MIDSRLLAEYSRQQSVRDRNYVGLLLWAAARAAEPIPATRPDPAWIRIRVMAERIPQAPDNYAQRSIPYFLQHPPTRDRIGALLDPHNEPAMEDALNDLVQEAIEDFMPRFAVAEVGSGQIAQWLAEYGF